MFVDAPSFPLTERAEDMDNPTLARRALLDLNSGLYEKRTTVAPHWSPEGQPNAAWRTCLVGMTVDQEAELAHELTFGRLGGPFVVELEGRFEGRVRGYEDDGPLMLPRVTAVEAARATGWRR